MNLKRRHIPYSVTGMKYRCRHRHNIQSPPAALQRTIGGSEKNESIVLDCRGDNPWNNRSLFLFRAQRIKLHPATVSPAHCQVIVLRWDTGIGILSLGYHDPATKGGPLARYGGPWIPVLDCGDESPPRYFSWPRDPDVASWCPTPLQIINFQVKFSQLFISILLSYFPCFVIVFFMPAQQLRDSGLVDLTIPKRWFMKRKRLQLQ